MKARWRVLVASTVVVLTAGAPALAQDAASTAQEVPAAAQNEVIGNPQLRDFSLNGTVTQRAPDPGTQQSAPAQTAPAPAGQPSQNAARSSQPARDSAAAPSRADLPPRQQARPSGSDSAVVNLPPPTPAGRIATPSLAQEEAPTLTSGPALVPAAAASDLDGAGGGLSMLPWLIAALAFAAAAAWYFLRQRPRESYAGAAHAFDAPSPVPPQVRTPPVRTPPPQVRAPPKPVSAGIVSTRLRPWLEIEFTPQRAIVDEQKAAVAFALSVFNSGSVPARDVLLEASLFNAGPLQDQQIRLFFDNPVAKGDRIPLIPPLQRVSVNTAVFLSRDQVRPIEVEGRKLFVPMIAFNALYGWSGGEGQTSASYLVGKVTKAGEKLAPFRLDLGPRVFRNLAAREHELRLRK